MRHAAGAICRPNCMQFAYTLSLPYKKCDYIFSSRLVSHCSLFGVIPQLTKCAMGNAQVLFALPPPLLLLLPLLTFFLFRKISSKKYMYIQFLAATLYPSLSRLTHIQFAATGSGSFFPSLSRLSLTLFLSKFFPPTCAFLSSFLVYL